MKAGDRVTVAPTVVEVGGRIGVIERIYSTRALVKFVTRRVIHTRDLTVEK